MAEDEALDTGARHTGLPIFQWCAMLLFGLLLLAWLAVLVNTAKGSWQGKLLTPPIKSPVPAAVKD